MKDSTKELLTVLPAGFVTIIGTWTVVNSGLSLENAVLLFTGVSVIVYGTLMFGDLSE